MTTDTEAAIAADLALCLAGEALTTGKLARRYRNHRKACFRALKEMNQADELDRLSDDEILVELGIGYTGRTQRQAISDGELPRVPR